LFSKGQSGPEIQVTFIDAADDHQIGVSLMPPSQIPKSFAPDTKIEIMGTNWHVESADPQDRAGYVATGELRLVLRALKVMDPQEILFSLPTINDELPPMNTSTVPAGLTLHEDDWRQQEFVAREFLGKVKAEIADVEAVRSQQVGDGFPRIHVRSRIPNPLGSAAISVADVAGLAGGVPREALALGGRGVAGGFAFASSDGAIYGREVGGRVVVAAQKGSPSAQPMIAFARRHGLILVDWVRCEIHE
jgi:hypothetical protein